MKKIYQYCGFAVLIAALIGVFVYGSQQVAFSKDKEPEQSPWVLRCADVADAKDQSKTVKNCEIFQRLSVKQTGQRIIEFVVGKDAVKEKQGIKRGVVILPLGVLIQSGVRMQIDELPAYKFDLHHCTDGGCFAFVDLNSDIIGKMKKGEKAKMTMKSVEGKNVNIVLSLAGFSAAVDKLK